MLAPRKRLSDVSPWWLGRQINNFSIRSFAGVALSRQARFVGDAEHQIEILNRYAGGAFAEIIEARHEQDVT